MHDRVADILGDNIVKESKKETKSISKLSQKMHNLLNCKSDANLIQERSSTLNEAKDKMKVNIAAKMTTTPSMRFLKPSYNEDKVN